jgi:hypothetical protein
MQLETADRWHETDWGTEIYLDIEIHTWDKRRYREHSVNGFHKEFEDQDVVGWTILK